MQDVDIMARDASQTMSRMNDAMNDSIKEIKVSSQLPFFQLKTQDHSECTSLLESSRSEHGSSQRTFWYTRHNNWHNNHNSGCFERSK